MTTTIEPPSPRAARSSRAQPVPKLGYQPGLDGLRAIAVVAVIMYHAQQNMPSSWMPGGFLGVEVFFVVSGYLITLLLISEHQRTHRVDLKQFWVRRGRRLLPALFAVLIVTMAIVGIGGRFNESLNEHVKDFRGMWASAWIYMTNWFEIGAGLNYADKTGRPPLLRHLWSLAVEEQFYIVWPLVMFAVLRVFRRRLPAVGVAFLAGAVAIAIYTAVTYDANDLDRINFLYLSTPTRASGLLLGAALAVFWRPWLVQQSGARHLGRRFDVLALVGLAFLAVTSWRWHFLVEGEDGPQGYDLLFRGGFLLVGLATVAVILATTHPGSLMGRRVLASQVLVWIGVRSYGLYLWHWPIFQLTRPIGDQSLLDPNNPDVPLHWLPGLVLRLALTVVVTEISFRVLETPVRNGALGRWWKSVHEHPHDPRLRRAFIAAAVVTMITAVATVSAFRADDVLAQQAECNADPAACELLDEGGGGGDASGAAPGSGTVVPATDDEASEASEASDASDDEGSTNTTDAPATDGTEATSTEATSTDDASTDSTADSTAKTTPATVPASSVKPLAIGDSVMLGAKAQLVDAGFRVDAAENRQFSKAAALIRSYEANGQVGDVVVLALATNGGITDKSVDKVMAELEDVPHVVFVTPQINGKSWEEPNHEVLLAAADRYENVSIVDWRELAQDKLQYAYKTGKDNDVQELYFWKDRIHLAPKGQEYYAQVIVEEVLRLGDG